MGQTAELSRISIDKISNAGRLISMNRLLLTALAISTLSLTHAARAEGTSDSAQDNAKGDTHGDSAEHHWQRSHWAVSISPRYYGLNSNGYSSAFTGAGLAPPKSGTVGMDFSVYAMTDSQWQLGIGFGSVSTGSDNGATTANYSDGFIGFWFAKELQINNDFDITLGSLLGYGNATMEVITPGISGQTSESAFVIEPKIIASYKICSMLKIGISGSYIEPLGQSQSIKGNTLTSGNISLHGASAGVEFTIGHFGPNEHKDEHKM
jgi:hypothetical protein